MKHSKAIMFVAVGLTAGLVLGSLSIASAAPRADGSVESAGLGLRIGQAMKDAGGRLIDLVSLATGLSVTEIAERRADGQSLADVAATEGVDPATVVDSALSVRSELLDARVADGTITAEEKDAALERMRERLQTRITSDEAPGCDGSGQGGMRRGGGQGMGGGQGGMRGAGCGGACSTVPADSN
ncbi:MAG: hypothetical protein U1E29_17265 [Coriobacteriia bacterium]|nr:hypothetical protein [Coriobacteriia bacterium]